MPARFEDLTSDTRPAGVHPDSNGSEHYTSTSRNYIQEDIVISGFSGRLPESSNIEEFRKNLYDHVDMVNDEPRRWPKGVFDLPTRNGKLKDDDLGNFDPQFFGVHQKQAECLDPQLRMMLESTYEAIVDAGKYLFDFKVNIIMIVVFFNFSMKDSDNVISLLFVLVTQFI